MYSRITCLSMMLVTVLSFAGTEALAGGTPKGERPSVLLLTDNEYGSSYTVRVGRVESIKSLLESYGWDLTVAAVVDTLDPCEWGGETFGLKQIRPDMKPGDIDIEEYDAVIVLPGRRHENLARSEIAADLLRRARDKGLVIAAWCRGVKLLALAGVIGDRAVIGHIDFVEDYAGAGSRPVRYSIVDPARRIFGNITPPIADGDIITTVRSLYYRNNMCQLIKNAVERKRNRMRHVLDLGRSPVWSAGTGKYATGIGLADIDRDGWLDIVASNGLDAAPQEADIFFGDGSSFENGRRSTLPGAIPAGNVYISDLDMNGYPDIAISHLGLSGEGFRPGRHRIWFNVGAPGNSPEAGEPAVKGVRESGDDKSSEDHRLDDSGWASLPANGFSCTGGDFDGDGDIDLVFGQGCNAIRKEDRKFQKTVLYSNNGGKIDTIPSWSSDSEYLINDLAAVDIDEDGDLDLVTSGKGYGISVFYNEGGKLETSPSWHSGEIIGARQMAFGDVNGDGYQDLAVAAPGKVFGKGGTFYLFRNEAGQLEKSPSWKCDSCQEPAAVRWADLDADGDLDLVGCGFYSDLGVFENSGGTLTDDFQWSFDPGGDKYWYEQIAVGDFDEDYMIDEVETLPSGGGRKLFFIRKNLHEIPYVRIGDRVLNPGEFCYDLQEGWLSLAEPPGPQERIEVFYRYSMDLDLAVTAIEKVCLFENLNVVSDGDGR